MVIKMNQVLIKFDSRCSKRKTYKTYFYCHLTYPTAQKMKFSIKDFFSKGDQILISCKFGHIY